MKIKNNLLLRIMNRFYLIIFFFTIIFSLANNVNGNENRILFKILDESFTTIDFEKRKNYSKFINFETKLNDDENLLNDFINVNIFYKYYVNNNINDNADINIKANELYNNILKKNINLEDFNIENYDEENIIKNLEKDIVRSGLLNEFINSKRNQILNKEQEIDLLYEFKITYINVYKNQLDPFKEKFNEKKFKKISDLEVFLNDNNIPYFQKEKIIDNINSVNSNLKNKISSNKKFFIIENSELITFININKKFETYEGLIINILNIKSKKKLNTDYLNCSEINKYSDKIKSLESIDYPVEKLNKLLQENLVTKNDYLTFKNDDEINYIMLCEIKFNEEILNNLNRNKKIKKYVEEIEVEFIERYSKIYRLNLINE